MLKQLRKAISDLKTAFASFIAVMKAHTATIEANTKAIEAIAAQSFHDKLDELLDHNAFIVAAKKRELERQGHK